MFARRRFNLNLQVIVYPDYSQLPPVADNYFENNVLDWACKFQWETFSLFVKRRICWLNCFSDTVDPRTARFLQFITNNLTGKHTQTEMLYNLGRL